MVHAEEKSNLEMRSDVEQAEDNSVQSDDNQTATKGETSPPVATSNDGLPPGYFTSPLFLGTYFAVTVSVMSGVAPFALAAPLLAKINQDIGSSPDIAWVGYVYNLILAISLSLVGRLTDIFGRRWFFICGNFLALVGTIICATAKTVPALIGGMAITSFGVSTQISFQYVLGELVPIGKRFLVMSTVFPWTMPLGGFGPVISTAFQNSTALRWRWCFWLCAILNVVSTALYFFFYHQPSFNRLEPGKTKLQALREMDWFGVFLFSAGFFIFLMGLTWGGNAYPWKSAAVLCSVLLGAALLVVFIVWEIYGPAKTPYLPLHLFRNGRWVAMMLCLAIGANQYYAISLVWPRALLALWPRQSAGNGYGWMSVLTGTGLQVGQIAGSLIANWLNKRALLIVSTTIGASFLAASACARADNLATVLGVIIPGFLAIGVQEAISGVFCTVALKRQEEIGVGGGLAATTRSGLSALGSVIYGAVLNNRLASTVPKLVSQAAGEAGLPATSVPALIGVLNGTGKGPVAGLTPQILDVATAAYQAANSLAFRDVMLTSMAFGVISVVCAVFTPTIDEEKAKVVSRVLEKEKIKV